MSRQWPSDDHLLIVDDDALFREAITLQLSAIGCACNSASSYEEALDVFQNKPEIGVVLVDQIRGSVRADTFIQSLRASRQDIIVVGNSGADRRSDFSAAGVSRFLRKPWRIEQLVDLVSRRITSCSECGVPLPLRHPRADEVGHSWECSFCGCRYRAVLDEGAPPDVETNARQVV